MSPISHMKVRLVPRPGRSTWLEELNFWLAQQGNIMSRCFWNGNHAILMQREMVFTKSVECKFLHYLFKYSLYAVLKHAFTLHIICLINKLN